MEPLQGHLKDFPKTMDLDEKTMLSIARMITYVTVCSTPTYTKSNPHYDKTPPEMRYENIFLDAKRVDKWLSSPDWRSFKADDNKTLCKKCEE